MHLNLKILVTNALQGNFPKCFFRVSSVHIQEYCAGHKEFNPIHNCPKQSSLLHRNIIGSSALRPNENYQNFLHDLKFKRQKVMRHMRFVFSEELWIVSQSFVSIFKENRNFGKSMKRNRQN